MAGSWLFRFDLLRLILMRLWLNTSRYSLLDPQCCILKWTRSLIPLQHTPSSLHVIVLGWSRALWADSLHDTCNSDIFTRSIYDLLSKYAYKPTHICNMHKIRFGPNNLLFWVTSISDYFMQIFFLQMKILTTMWTFWIILEYSWY